MKVREIRLKNFKRFTDTELTGIPETAQLVMLVGSNGSGKSSLIDAVHTWHRHHWASAGNWDESYHGKQIPGAAVTMNESVKMTFYDPQPATDEERRKAVYVRSAYRNDPDFQVGSFSRIAPALHEHRIQRLIDNDQAVSGNYHRLVSQGFTDIFEQADVDLTIGEFREQAIGEIRDAILRLFPGLILNSLGNPLSDGTFRFDKGDSKGFRYKNLSGGEKAAFDLILDLLIKKREFDNTVFFIDEPEAHISPALQTAFLDELHRTVPGNSQLWLATHSLGMIRTAREIEHQTPGTVVFLDFDQANFDVSVKLGPVEPNRPFWKRAMRIALDDLAGYVTPERVVLCEGGRLDGGADFDADCYNAIFQAKYPQVMFLGAGNSHDILNDPRGVMNLLSALSTGVRVSRVIDRDDRSDDEISDLQAQRVRVLSFRTIESYLLDDSVLRDLCESLGQPELAEQLLQAKRNALENSVANSGPADDYKRPAGDVYNAAKQLFPKVKLGSDKRAFMKEFCAPLIRPGTQMYESLERDIFGS